MEPTTQISPPVFYFGTPVVLLTTLNADGTSNISPLSSAWAIGNRYVLGLGRDGHAVTNLRLRPELVINLASSHQVAAIEAIAPTTGRSPVPAAKQSRYRHVADKWALADLTPCASVDVAPARIAECPVQMEGRVVQAMTIADGDAVAVEAAVVRTHVHTGILGPRQDRIDTDAWDPLYYTFREYFAQGDRVGTNFRADLLGAATVGT
jgi:flavin reductase (DIM6/NTAB) family NADH-FMN oxidoreductase RutF